jgi:50S ribosomal protein L16 3-hydroxylase
MMRRMQIHFFGGMTAQQFVQEYWQKKPLLIRNAFPDFGGMLSPEDLAGLACEEEAQSRLVLCSRGKWTLEQGPFDEQRFARLPEKGWSLLVQGVNHFLPEADALLHQFDFIPRARLDDLMVSFAPDGGGVGPHFDSYDVFLLQGQGKRLWRVSSQSDMELVPDAPLRILKNFHTDQEWMLEPGDMLYLPPRLAHWGIAVGDCMTWSIGFRAPSAQELATQFLGYLQDHVRVDGIYADPDLRLQRHPAEISGQMLGKVRAMLDGIRWDGNDIVRFLGTYLTEPKPHVLFDPPRRIGQEKFRQRLMKNGISLDLKTLVLFHGNSFFINGESVEVDDVTLSYLVALADHRTMPPGLDVPQPVLDLMHQWYGAGYLIL